MKEVMEEMGVERGKRKGGLGKDKLAFDELEKERRKKEEQAIYDARLKKLQDERLALQNAQEVYRNAHQEQNFDEIDDDGVPTVVPKKLDTKLSMFDAVQHQRQLEEKQDLLKDKMKKLQEEMDLFKQQQDEEESGDEGEVKTTQGVNVERNYRPGKVNTKFDACARAEFEQQSYNALEK